MSGATLSHWDFDLPQGWRLGKVRHMASVTLGKMIETSDDPDAGSPYLRAANVQPDGVLALTDMKKMRVTPKELAHLALRRGDVVVVEGGQGGYGRAAYLAEDLPSWGFQNSINRLRPSVADGRYLTYYLLAARYSGYIQSLCNIVSMPHFTAEKLAATPIPVPPILDQHMISDYLDREIAQIDALIGKQQKLIEMLDGRRASVVSDTLNQARERRRVKFLAEVTLGKMLDAGKSSAADSKVLPYVRAADILKSGAVNTLNLNTMPFTPSEVEWLDLRRDDVLVVEGGAMGRPAYVVRDVDGVSFQKTVNRVRPRLGFTSGRFLYHALWLLDQTGHHRAHLDAVSMPHLTAEKLLTVEVPWGPLDVQLKLAEQIDKRIDRINILVARSQKFITLARERRAALITAAVTGQIDVREAS